MFNKGGHKVAAGTYWNMVNGERLDLEQEGTLPGKESTLYIKAPGALVLAAGPFVGLVFAVFLPFIGILMFMSFLGGKIIEGMANAAAGMVTFGWRPIEAYLMGRKGKKSERRKNNRDAHRR